LIGNKKVLIAGGGTGGHFFPAQTLSESLIKNGFLVEMIGSKNGIEAKYATNCIFKIHLLNISGIQRSIHIKSLMMNLLFPIKFILSLIQSIRIILNFKPNVVVGTGGYSSGIPLIAAIILGKKTLIQEQNCYPGITTRVLSSWVNEICIAYKDSKKYLSKNNKIILTGNPIRNNLKKYKKNDAKSMLGIKNNKKVLLIIGGSQGAKTINNYFLKYYKKIINEQIHIIWQVGSKHYSQVYTEINLDEIDIYDFIEDIDTYISASDLIISRAGALTLSELAYFEKPILLIPFPYASQNHQFLNAIYYKKNDAAILFEESLMNGVELVKILLKLLKNTKKQDSLIKNIKKIAKPNATNIINDRILRLAN